MEAPETTLTDGSPVPEDSSHLEIDPATGMQRGYVVLSEEERARGFVRPLRFEYLHVGSPSGNPTHPTRPLTDEEAERHAGQGYVLYEDYEGTRDAVVGRYWTQKQLDGGGGCSSVTKISLPIAETYARQPSFYGMTFCGWCRGHFPVGPEGEFVWTDGTRVGT